MWFGGFGAALALSISLLDRGIVFAWVAGLISACWR
jgi:hypothetical protein